MTSRERSGLRIAIAGATGIVGREVVAVLEGRSLPIDEILPIASDQSLGGDVEFRDELFPVRAEVPSLRGVDLVVVCSPPGAALEVVRHALRAEAPCIDCSGALAGNAEVPLWISALSPPGGALGAPLVATPAGPAAGWALALAPLVEVAGLSQLAATLLRSVARVGRAGIDALSRETLALLGQQDVPEPETFAMPVAFDCTPLGAEPRGADDPSVAGTAPVWELSRLLAGISAEPTEAAVSALAARISLQTVQVPAFVGDLTAIALTTREPLSVSAARELLAKAPGVEVLDEHAVFGPSMRGVAGSEVARVGQVRADATRDNGLLLWVAADAVRLAAANAVDLAATRLRLN